VINTKRCLVAGTIAVALAFAVPSVGAAGSDVTVTVRNETFVDHSRPTPAVPKLKVKAKTARTLPTRIWLPDGDGPYPLIVYAHGCGGTALPLAAMLRAWVRAGFVVAAPRFPLSSRKGGGVACTTDVRNQPGDISFVITSLLDLDVVPGGLGGILDTEHIGVAGNSFGGITTLGVAFSSCCRDTRIDAAISYAGTPTLPGTDFRGIHTPLLLVHGDADPLVKYRGSVTAFERAQGPRWLLTVIGGGHGSFLLEKSRVARAVRRASIDFWRGNLAGDANALAQLEKDAVVPGKTTLRSAG
jgi:predicted dienelactone hydrolase